MTRREHGDVPGQLPPRGADVDRSTHDDRPLDAAALWRDDALLTRLGVGAPADALVWDDEPLSPPLPGQPVAEPVDPEDDQADRVTALLLALRRDIDEPLPVGSRAGGELAEPRRLFGRLAPRTAAAAASAALVLSLGGVAAAAIEATPRSWLYPLHQVLMGDDQPTASQRAAAEAWTELRAAEVAIVAHDTAAAQRHLRSATALTALVRPADGAAELTARVTELRQRLAEVLAATGPAGGPGTRPDDGDRPSRGVGSHGSGDGAGAGHRKDGATGHRSGDGRPGHKAAGRSGDAHDGRAHDGGAHDGQARDGDTHRDGAGGTSSERSGAGGQGADKGGDATGSGSSGSADEAAPRDDTGSGGSAGGSDGHDGDGAHDRAVAHR